MFDTLLERVMAERDAFREENEQIKMALEQARILIVSAQVHMPTWPPDRYSARGSWIRDANKWLSINND